MTEEYISIGSGDDGIEYWEVPFSKPIEVIGSLLLEAESFGFAIEWDDVVKGIPELQERVEHLRGGTELIDVVEAMSPAIVTTYDQWGGESPGRSGTSVEMLVTPSKKESVLAKLMQLESALKSYWDTEGFTKEAERQELEIKQEHARIERERVERRREEKAKKEQEQKKEWDSLVEQVQRHVDGGSGLFFHSDRLLITPDQGIYVIVENTVYGRNDGWTSMSNRLESLGYLVTSIIESYPPDHSRIPYFAGSKRAEVCGWLQSKSLLLGTDGAIDADASSWRERFILQSAGAR